jgi:peptide/nickel transport system permease protein
MIYGMRTSVIDRHRRVLFQGIMGIVAGLTAGYVGGRVDSILMRITDIQLDSPT